MPISIALKEQVPAGGEQPVAARTRRASFSDSAPMEIIEETKYIDAFNNELAGLEVCSVPCEIVVLS